ncbi:MAG TPA: amidohydrolase family protein [Acidimicrobiales bacterium]|nr:amidohydrolase family protein [Acidimicrobiales bacterium]
MTTTAPLSAAEIHRRLGHPVVDADGHYLELMPLVEDEIVAYLEEEGGSELRERYLHGGLRPFDTVQFQVDRADPAVRRSWRGMSAWWGNPVADARERATSHLPRLLYERLDELGVDVMLTYPSWTLGFLGGPEPELRAPVCRAVNRYAARLFAPFTDRLRPAALIPMDEPATAAAEIDHAVGELGFSLVLLAGYRARDLDGASAGRRLDMFGIDSAADYDVVWNACARNRVAPVFHSSLQSTHPARSVTNYVYNHIGGLAHAHEALCKSLFMGGVYRRFPMLRFGYLEGGVMWGASLLADAVGHWEKRGAHAIGSLDPARLDVSAVMALLRRYGSEEMVASADEVEDFLSRRPGRPAELDDFAAAGVRRVEDLIAPLSERSFFGCEADDPLVPLALHLRIAHRAVSLRPMLGTDVSHWDAPVMNQVLPEAYEAVEDGQMTTEEFEAFVFANAVRLHGGVNPAFFAGTPCEKGARAVLGSG